MCDQTDPSVKNYIIFSMDTIIVTIANRGLGQATARYSLQRGHTVVLSGCNQETLRSQAESLRQEGLIPKALDATSLESVEGCAAEVAARYDSCVVNNGGIMVKSETAFEDFSPQTFWTTIEMNVLGIFRVLKAFVPLLANSRNPRIGDIRSGYGIESFWSVLKRSYHGMFPPLSATRVQRYVNEFAGRQTLRHTSTLQQMNLIVKGFIGRRWELVG